MGVDHDYSIVYPCDSLANLYYVRNGLPPIYSKFIDEGGPGIAVGLFQQAAQGLETISVDVSGGYCSFYQESGNSYSYSTSHNGEQVIFPAMAYLKSRTPMAGPNGEDVYYAFTYENNMLIGVRSNGPAVDGPVLTLSYEVNGTAIQPGSSVTLGQTITVNWEISGLEEPASGSHYTLFLETPVTLGADNEVLPGFVEKQGDLADGSVEIYGTSGQGSFTVTPLEGDRLSVKKTLKRSENYEYTTLETWDEAVFILTGSQAVPLNAEVVFTQNAETRTVTAEITANAACSFFVSWYADEAATENRIGGGYIQNGQGTTECVVTRNVENDVILAFSLSDYDRGLTCSKEYHFIPQGFAPLPENACGVNLTWQIENGTLILTGSGAMFDYMNGSTPWFAQNHQITSLQLPYGITYIGEMAFHYTGITQVNLPNTVEVLSDCAFLGCHSLTFVSIPSSVRAINGDPFYMSDHLTTISVDPQNPWFKSENQILVTKDGTTLVAIPEGASTLVLPEGLTVIPYMSSFNECHASSITIPVSVTRIEADFPWYGNLYGELTDIYYPGTRKQFSEIQRMGWDGEPASMFPVGNMVTLHYAATPQDKTFVLPEDLQTIDAEAFQGTHAEEVVIPYGTESIGSGAFSGNASLIIVHIPSSVTEISGTAFSGCHPDLLILGETGSAAETFANDHSLFFEEEP